MHFINDIVQNNIFAAWIVLIVSFFILTKSADIFVDCAVDLACAFKVPKLIIGIVLVSLATTTPELSVSMISALRGQPDMAMGNAIGSVICDDGLALGLAGLLTVGAIHVTPSILKLSGGFLFFVQFILFAFIFPDLTLNRIEGAAMVLLFAFYIYLLIIGHKRGSFPMDQELADAAKLLKHGTGIIILLFIAAIAGIIIASDFIVTSATAIAVSFGIPESIIALTLVALGTSIPEVATCIVAVRKGHGAVAVGNIIGADIMNICWVAGASAVANDLTLGRREFNFMFPAMFIIVTAMLGMLWARKRLTRRKGIILLALYAAYIASFFIFFGSKGS